MKRLSFLISGLLLFICTAFYSSAQTKDIAYYIANAPFKMAPVTVPAFPNKTFSITDYGAVGNGKKLNTEAIEKAITTCSDAGGGTVLIPAGVWLTGSIELKSNVEIHTETGTVVSFTTDHSKYPMIKASKGSKKLVPASPIYGYDLNNIAITGNGTFDGAGDSWRPVKKSKVSPDKWQELLRQGGGLSSDGKVWWPDISVMDGDARPHLLYLVNCDNILLQDITLKNSPKFMFYPTRCTNLTMIGVHVYNEWWAQNGDGIDISACKGVVIYRCTVNAGDDGICMKSSGTPDDKDAANLANVIIAGCTVYRAHGGFVIGSNTDGGMKNVYVTDCNYIGTDVGIRIKSNSGRGGWVRDIYVTNINMKDIVNEAVLFDTYYQDAAVGKKGSDDGAGNKIPDFRNIYISNIKCDGAQTAISITGLPEMKVKQIYFENMDITSGSGFVSKDAEDIYLKHVKIHTEEPVYKTNGCKNINITE